jgi:hypothetical protein
MCTLSIRISSLRACSAYASVRYMYDEGIQNKHMKNRKTDVCTEHTRKELMCNGDAKSCWRPYSAGAQHSVSDQIQNLQTKTWEGSGPQRDKHLPQRPFKGKFFR